MEALLRDIRFAVRVLLRRPFFTAVIVFVIALTVGASTVIISAADTILLRPMKFKNPDDLVMIWETNPKLKLNAEEFPASPPNFLDWRERSESFEQMAAFKYYPFNLTGAGDPERLNGATVSVNLFGLLGVQPFLGTLFPEGDEASAPSNVVLLSHSLWQRRFNSDPAILGKSITLNDQSYTVLGVMPQGISFPQKAELPPGFQTFPEKTDLWAPLVFTENDRLRRGAKSLGVIARLKPGVSLNQAKADVLRVADQLQTEQPKSNTNWSAQVVSFPEQVVKKVRPVLLLLLGAVVLVVLIACANLTNLLLGRATARTREIAVRSALGAGRAAIIRQLLTENMIVSLVGGGLGIALASAGLGLLLALLPAGLPRVDEIKIDFRVLSFTLLLSILIGIMFGLLPALQASKVNLSETLKETGGTISAARSHRLRSLFALSQVAMATVLLIWAAMLVKSFSNMQAIDPGFKPENVLMMEIDLPLTRYPDYEKVVSFYKQAIDQVKTVPGVESVGITTAIPLSGLEQSLNFTCEPRPPVSVEETALAVYAFVSPDYFRTIGIPLQAGRDFTYNDDTKSPGVIIVNEALAKRCWPDENPVGKSMTIVPEGKVSRQVVGVVGSVKYSALDEESKPTLYLPITQLYNNYIAVTVRTSSDPMSLSSAIRGRIWDVYKEQPISNMKTMQQQLSDSVARARFSMILIGIFAVVALVLAIVGIYAVLSYSVVQRSQEIAIRLALGAQPTHILRMLLAQGVGMSVIGLVAGLVIAFATSSIVKKLLYNVSTTDPVIFLAVSSLLVAIALIASYVPSRRATKIDPIVSLRQR